MQRGYDLLILPLKNKIKRSQPAAAPTGRGVSEQAGEEGGDGGFDAQDALAQLHRLQAGLGKQVDLVRNPATFGADRQRYRFAQCARARRKIAGMADQAEGAFGYRRQSIFYKWLEALLDEDLRQHGIAGLFEAEDQILANRFRLQKRRLPEALLDAVAVDQNHLRHAHGRHGLEHPAQHFRPWQGQYQRQRQLGRWRLIEADAQLGFASLKAQQFSRTHQPIDAPDTQAVADFGSMHFLHMRQAPVAQHDAVGRDEVGLFEQQQVHAWVAGGWSL